MRIPCIPVWIKAMLTAVILVLLVKTFAFTSCTIPSTGMENSLYQGERVLVNKWSYGFRVPFSIWRWLGKTAGKGDIVLFNNPNPRFPQTSVGNREVFISRVVGIPGDTLMLNDELWVTDEQVLSPDSKSLYVYSHTEEETMQAAMQQVNIQGNRLVGYAEGKYIRTFSHYEYYLLKQKLAGKVDLIPLYHKDISKSHPFVIPEKGKPVKVYPWNVTLLCNTIVRHEGRVASVRGDTLYVGGKPVEAYTFNKNYYWMAFPTSALRPNITTLAPSSAKWAAIAFPKTPVPPVITTTWSFTLNKLFMILFFMVYTFNTISQNNQALRPHIKQKIGDTQIRQKTVFGIKNLIVRFRAKVSIRLTPVTLRMNSLTKINLTRNKFHAIFRCSFHMGMNIDQIAY